MKRKKIILIDGSYFVYSIYYAFPSLINSAGEPTGVIYGMTNMLRKILIRYNPDYIGVIFDAPGLNFRNDLFSDYKLYRRPMPENLRIQLAPIFKVIRAMGISVIVIPGVEADDVIGTLVDCFSNRFFNCFDIYIFTGDKDMCQLVSYNIYVMYSNKIKMLLTVEEVERRYGVVPKFMVDYLALVGDITDNIPGVPGIGKVTAKFLLQKLGGLSTIYYNLNKITELIGLRRSRLVFEKLKKHRDLAFLSYRLATIKRDVSLVGISINDLFIKQMNFDELLSLFHRYEFKRLKSDLCAGNW